MTILVHRFGPENGSLPKTSGTTEESHVMVYAGPVIYIDNVQNTVHKVRVGGNRHHGVI